MSKEASEGAHALDVALGAIARRTRKLETQRLMSMDFPTLDELEMDVPILNAHLSQSRLAPEDEEELELQYMLHFDPSLHVRAAR